MVANTVVSEAVDNVLSQIERPGDGEERALFCSADF